MDSQPDGNTDELQLEAFHRKPRDQGLSLEELGDAFAGMLRTGDSPYEATGEQAEAPDGLRADATGAVEPAEITPRTILEAMLFVGSPDNTPLTSRYVASLMRGVRPAEIDALVRDLNAQYAEDGCPYEILSDGPGYRLALRDNHSRIRDKFYGRAKQVRLSQAAIEVLALVCYNQPVTADDIHRARGIASGAILSQLVRRQLLRLERPDEKPRAPVFYTTDRFLRLFNLKTLDDLPQSQDLDKE